MMPAPTRYSIELRNVESSMVPSTHDEALVFIHPGIGASALSEETAPTSITPSPMRNSIALTNSESVISPVDHSPAVAFYPARHLLRVRSVRRGQERGGRDQKQSRSHWVKYSDRVYNMPAVLKTSAKA